MPKNHVTCPHCHGGNRHADYGDAGCFECHGTGTTGTTEGTERMSGIWVMEYDNFGGPCRAVVVADSEDDAMKVAGVGAPFRSGPTRIGTSDDSTRRELAHESP